MGIGEPITLTLADHVVGASPDPSGALQPLPVAVNAWLFATANATG